MDLYFICQFQPRLPWKAQGPLQQWTQCNTPSLPQGNLNPFPKMNFFGGKEKSKTFQGLLGTDSEPKLIPWNQKHCSGPPVKVGTIGSDITNWDFVLVNFIVCLIGHISYSVFYPVLRCTIWTNKFYNCHNSHISSMINEVWTMGMKNAKL